MPALTGAVVALVSAGRTGVELLAIGGLGLAATSGVLAYELRNGELTYFGQRPQSPYYGAADSSICVATARLHDLIDAVLDAPREGEES